MLFMKLASTVVEMLNQLSDSDFARMESTVKQYFSNELPLPPSIAQQQIVQNKVKELSAQINSLWNNMPHKLKR
jgi:hypothetical protein